MWGYKAVKQFFSKIVGGIEYVGKVKATSFEGDGSLLTNVGGDLLNDTTPQLGGELDTNGNKIKAAAGYTEIDGASGVRLRSAGSMKMLVGAVGVQPMANVIPNVGNSYDLGVSGYGFKEVHAASFHGDGSNLTNLPENDLLKYVVVKGKMIFPATPSNVVYDQHYKQGLDEHVTADLGNIQNYQRELVDYSTFASGKTAAEMVTVKGLYEVVGWEYQISSKTADDSNPDLNFYPQIYDNTGALVTFGGITLNNKYVDNAYTTTSGKIINLGHTWVSPYLKRRTGSVAIQETMVNYEIRFKLAKVV